MNFCQFCKTEIRKQDKFCIGCGNTIPQENASFWDEPQGMQWERGQHFNGNPQQGKREMSPIIEDVSAFSYGKREILTQSPEFQQAMSQGSPPTEGLHGKREISPIPEDFSEISYGKREILTQPEALHRNWDTPQEEIRGRRELPSETVNHHPPTYETQEISTQYPVTPQRTESGVSFQNNAHGRRELSPILEDVSAFSYGKREILTNSLEYQQKKYQNFPSEETPKDYSENPQQTLWKETHNPRVSNSEASQEFKTGHLGYSTTKGIPQEEMRDFSPETEDFSQQSYGRREFLSQVKTAPNSFVQKNTNDQRKINGNNTLDKKEPTQNFTTKGRPQIDSTKEKDYTQLNTSGVTVETPIQLDWDTYYTAKGKAHVLSQEMQRTQESYIPREENPFRKEKQRVLSSQTRVIEPVSPRLALDEESPKLNSNARFSLPTEEKNLEWDDFYASKEEDSAVLTEEQQQWLQNLPHSMSDTPNVEYATSPMQSELSTPRGYDEIIDSEKIPTTGFGNLLHVSPKETQNSGYSVSEQNTSKKYQYPQQEQAQNSLQKTMELPKFKERVQQQPQEPFQKTTELPKFKEQMQQQTQEPFQKTTELPKFKDQIQQQAQESFQKTTELPKFKEQIQQQTQEPFQKTTELPKFKEKMPQETPEPFLKNDISPPLTRESSQNFESHEDITQNTVPSQPSQWEDINTLGSDDTATQESNQLKTENPMDQYITPSPTLEDSRSLLEKTSELPAFVDYATVLEDSQRKKVKEKTGKLPKITEEQMRGKRAIYDHESTQDEVFMQGEPEEHEPKIRFQRQSETPLEKSGTSASNKSEFAHIKKRLGKVISNHDTDDLWYMANRKQSLLQIIFIASLCVSGVVFLQFDTFATVGVQDFDGQMTLALFCLSFFTALFHGIQVGMMGRLASDLAYQQEQLSVCKFGICGIFEGKEFAVTYDKVKKIAVEPYEPMGGGKMRGFYPLVREDGKVSFHISKGRSLAITLSSGEIYYFNYLGNIDDLVKDIPEFAKLYHGDVGAFFETRPLTKNEAEPLPEAVARIQMTEYHSVFNVLFVIIFIILIYFSL